MEDEHRLTIIKEIEYWKKHRLLPEHYCNFLIALYTEGEDMKEINQKTSGKQSNRGKGIERFQLTLLYLLLPFSFVVVYFTEIQIYLQLVILILLLSYSIWTGYYFKGKGHFYFHFSLIVSLFLVLSLTLLLEDMLFQQTMITIIGISFNFLIWITLGFYYKFNYLIIAGLFGIVFSFIYYFL